MAVELANPDDWFSAFAERVPAPAVAAAVARPEGLAWSAALGSANLELEVAARPEHRFRLGSVSKIVTTTAAAKLISRGALDLDAPISTWLPELPAHHRETTLRQLFTHTAGVRHYLPKDHDGAAPGGTIIQRHYPDGASILALFIDDPLVAERGTTVSYSSFGYTLASLVMEEAAEKPFLAIVADEIAQPFALPTLCADEVLSVVPDRVAGYFSAAELEMLAERMPGFAPLAATGTYANIGLSNPSFCWAGAGLLASMPDLASFGAALLDSPHTQLTPAERELLFTPLTEGSAEHPPLGLGWRVDADKQSRTRWHHAGTTPGGRAALVIYPELGLSLALASNVMTAPGDALGAASELADRFA